MPAPLVAHGRCFQQLLHDPELGRHFIGFLLPQQYVGLCIYFHGAHDNSVAVQVCPLTGRRCIVGGSTAVLVHFKVAKRLPHNARPRVAAFCHEDDTCSQ